MSLVGQKLQSVSPRWNSEVMCDRFIQQNQNEHRHSNNCTVLLQHTVMTTVTVLCHMSYVQTVNSIGKCDHGGLMVWPSERGADLRRPLNVTSQYTSQFVIFSALFYRTSCAMFCCFVTSETKCWRANFDNLCSVCLLHVWMVLNINSCFTAKWHCVWQFGLYSWNRAWVFIYCAMWRRLLCHISYRLFQRSPTKLKLKDIVDGRRVIRNVHYHLPIDTAQYTRSLESLTAQLWKPQIPHKARCVFFKVETESLNIIQTDFLLLQSVRHFFERIQKCIEGLRMRLYGKKSDAPKKEYTVMRYRWYLIGFTCRNIAMYACEGLRTTNSILFNVLVFCK